MQTFEKWNNLNSELSFWEAFQVFFTFNVNEQILERDFWTSEMKSNLKNRLSKFTNLRIQKFIS